MWSLSKLWLETANLLDFVTRLNGIFSIMQVSVFFLSESVESKGYETKIKWLGSHLENYTPLTFSCSKPAIEALDKRVIYVQS